MTTASASHAYAAPGTYLITLTATDANGVSATKSVAVTVDADPVSSLGAAPNPTDVGVTVDFKGSVAGGTGLDVWSWNFGDGSPSSSSQNPSHVYALAGSYIVALDVHDDLGVWSNQTATIIVNSAPTLTASSSSFTQDAGLFVNFTATTGDGSGAFTYLWNFGDGFQSTVAAPRHAFLLPATYTVTLTVTDVAGGSANTSLTITVLSDPIAHASAKSNPIDVGEVDSFTASMTQGLGTPTFLWSFGDGTTNTSQDPNHDFTKVGTYLVTLLVTDGAGDHANASISLVVVSDPTVALTASQTLLDSGEPVQFAPSIGGELVRSPTFGPSGTERRAPSPTPRTPTPPQGPIPSPSRSPTPMASAPLRLPRPSP